MVFLYIVHMLRLSTVFNQRKLMLMMMMMMVFLRKESGGFVLSRPSNCRYEIPSYFQPCASSNEHHNCKIATITFNILHYSQPAYVYLQSLLCFHTLACSLQVVHRDIMNVNKQDKLHRHPIPICLPFRSHSEY